MRASSYGNQVEGPGEQTRLNLQRAIALLALGLFTSSCALQTIGTSSIRLWLALGGVATALALPKGPGIVLARMFSLLQILSLVGVRGGGFIAALALAILLSLNASKENVCFGLTLGRVPVGPTLLLSIGMPLAAALWLLTQGSPLIENGWEHLQYFALFGPAAPMALSLAGALLEELFWRGVVQGGLRTLFPFWISALAPALAFALLHPHYFPTSGAAKVLMPALWGVSLSWLRARSDGVLAPIVAHGGGELTSCLLLSLPRFPHP